MEVRIVNLSQLKTLVRSKRVKKVAVFALALQHYIIIAKTEIYNLTDIGIKYQAVFVNDKSVFLFIDSEGE